MNQLHPDLKEFRLGLYCADFAEAYSFLRVAGPFQTMAHEDRRLKIIRPERGPNGQYQLTWDWILQCDAIFFFHPLEDHHMHCLATARNLGRPVWVEIVDDVLSVPPHSPTYQTFKDKRWVREQLTTAIDLASFVSVTSQWLKDALVNGCDLDSTKRPSLIAQGGKVSDKIVIVPEAALFEADMRPRKKVITWRGLMTHDQDTEGVLAQVCAVARDFPDWEWCLFGQPSREFQEQLMEAATPERVRISPLWPTPIDMMTAWKGVAPYLHLVPLEDNAFNRSKSHLAYYEASAVGAAVIVPDYLPEWQQPGVIPYHGGVIEHNGKNNLEAVLRREMLGFGSAAQRTALHPNVEVARAAIYPGRTLAARNERRWMILNRLAGPMIAQAQGVPMERGTRIEDRGLKMERKSEAPSSILDSPSSPEFRSHSQAGQDRFIHELIVLPENLRDGSFLDIGSNDPVGINNTFALEQIGWRGLMVDVDSKHAGETRSLRASPFVCQDATKIDWTRLLALYGLGGKVIDYVSLDVDAATLGALDNLLKHGVRFRAATIEHDCYEHGPELRGKIRERLIEQGYRLLAADVKLLPDMPFEDWWVDKKLASSEVMKKFCRDGALWQELFNARMEDGESKMETAEIEVAK